MQQHPAIKNLPASSIIAQLAASRPRSRSRIPFKCPSRPCPFSLGRVQVIPLDLLPALFGNYGKLAASIERMLSTHHPQQQRSSLFHSICFRWCDPSLRCHTHYSSCSVIRLVLVSDLSVNYLFSVNSQNLEPYHLANDLSLQ